MPEPILCTYRDGISYPIATLDELERQMPGLKQRFESYAAFAGQTVQDIFGSELIANSYHASARMLGSALFLNIGDGMYTISALPAMAQFSPVRGVVSGDLNRDGAMDLVLAGNNYHVRPSIGRYDASYGLCLLGDGKGNFVSMLPVESGLKIEGDARRLHWIRIRGEPCLVAPVNNGKLQLFRAGI
jgi:hypothetical protein